MPKITKHEGRKVIQANTKAGSSSSKNPKPSDWWNAKNKQELAQKLLGTALFLKQQNQYRYKQASIFAHLYGNLPLFGGAGTNLSRINMAGQLPMNRPTMSIVTSIVDTIVSRMEMNRPRPLFLTDNGDYKQRSFSKQMNGFIAGEFYQTKYYELRQKIRRDSCIWGTGVIKILEDLNKRVALERRLATQLVVDSNEAFLGDPRQLFEFSLVDRDVLHAMFPKKERLIESAEKASPEQGVASSETASDLVMVVEAWHKESGPGFGDGLHAIACSSGDLGDEGFTRKDFPFVFSHYAVPQVGFWGQGVAERQMGNQSAINQLLMTIHESINLVGVPRVFLEKGSKVSVPQLTNEVGAVVEYEGTKPEYSTAPCVPVELYQEVQNVINRGYQEEGVSQLAANSEKPAGLNSGEALRQYDDVQQDRLASLDRRDEQMAIDIAYQITWKAREIAKRDGSYQTVYPDKKNGTQAIDLPDSKMLDDPFVIQCFDVSALPRDPSGRFQKITEWVQAGMYSPQEGRRLMGLPDTEQEDRLLNAAEERILKQLDGIVYDGKFSPPDPFTDLGSADTIVTQYYNLFTTLKLEPKKEALLRKYKAQVLFLKNKSMPAIPTTATPAQGQVGKPQANPEAPPTQQLIPNVSGAV